MASLQAVEVMNRGAEEEKAESARLVRLDEMFPLFEPALITSLNLIYLLLVCLHWCHRHR